MLKRSYFYVMILIFSLPSLAQESNLDPVAKVCFGLIPVIDSAFTYRAQGKTKDEMLAPLPSLEILQNADSSNPKILLGLQMLEIIKDIYSFEGLARTSYGAYRAETCYRFSRALPTNESLDDVVDQLRACEQLNEDEIYSCGFNLAEPNS